MICLAMRLQIILVASADWKYICVICLYFIIYFELQVYRWCQIWTGDTVAIGSEGTGAGWAAASD